MSELSDLYRVYGINGILLFVFFVLGLSLVCVKLFDWQEENKRRRENERQEGNRKWKEQNDLYHLRRIVDNLFRFDLDEVKESVNQDEIVRLVNLMAVQTAMACVKQDKACRGGKEEPFYSCANNACEELCWANIERDPRIISWHQGASWFNVVESRKGTWANVRKIALQIAPELKDRLPHFSEFEPLKSYNEEHLLGKRTG
jgi:hypothetical protein